VNYWESWTTITIKPVWDMKSISACWSSPFAPRLAAALVIFLIALLLRLTILPYDAGYTFVTFYPATFITFLLCGPGPGAVVTALSAIASLYCWLVWKIRG
jgi:hypothetical protein